MAGGSSGDQFDAVLSWVLRAGVLLSAVIVCGGGIVFLAAHGLEHPAYGTFRAEPDALRSVRGIVHEARRLDGRGLIQLGLLLLIATPIARVAASVVGFIRQRDWLYVALTLTVLLLLAYGLVAGS